ARLGSGVVVLTWPYWLTGDMPSAASAEPPVTSELPVPVEAATESARLLPARPAKTPEAVSADCSSASVETRPGPLPNCTVVVAAPPDCTLRLVPARPGAACSRLVEVPVAPATPSAVAAGDASTWKLTSVLFEVSCRYLPVPSSEAVTAPFG